MYDGARLVLPDSVTMLHGRATPYTQPPSPSPEPDHRRGRRADMPPTPHPGDRPELNLEDVVAEDGEPLAGDRLRAVALEVGRKFGIDMEEARDVNRRLKSALTDSWAGLDDAAADVGGRVRVKTKITKHLARLPEIELLFSEDDAATECLGSVRQAYDVLLDLATENLADSQADLDTLKRHVVALIDVMAPLEGQPPPPTCGICYTRPVDTVAVPCGHSICGACARRAGRQGTCCFCRQGCTFSRLFFSR